MSDLLLYAGRGSCTHLLKMEKEEVKETVEKETSQEQQGLREAGFKTAIPFVLYTALVAGVLVNYDTCNIHVPKRKDCGYPGISMTECSLWGKWSSTNADGPREILRCLSGWLMLAFLSWTVSRYDMQSVLMYVMLAMLATFHQTSCCYDGNVPGGVPHCYC